MCIANYITKSTKTGLGKLKTDASLNCHIDILGDTHGGKNLNDSVRLSFYLTFSLLCLSLEYKMTAPGGHCTSSKSR